MMNHMKKYISSQNSMYQSILKPYYSCVFQTFKWKNIVSFPNIAIKLQTFVCIFFSDFGIPF